MKCLVFGTNIELAHTKALADAGNEVYYYTDYVSSFPSFDDYASGVGIDNIKKIHNPFTMIDKVDKILTFDVYYGDLFEYLRKQGKDVFGGGVACQLELDRKLLKNTLKILKIPTPDYDVVKGFRNIKSPAIVKLSYFRGSAETFLIQNEADKEAVINKLYREFGNYIDVMEFIVEKPIDTKNFIEIGIDAFFNEGFVFPMLLGLEYSKGCYIGRVVEKLTDLPKPMQQTMLALETALKKMNYKGMISTEEFVNIKTGEHYFLDITVRGAYPLSLAYPYWITNYADVLLKDAKPKYKAKYVVAVPFSIEETKYQFVNVSFPENDKRYQFEALMKIKNKYSLPKQEQPVQGVVCEAFTSYNSTAAIFNTMQDLLSQVKAYSLQSEIEKLQVALEEFKVVA